MPQPMRATSLIAIFCLAACATQGPRIPPADPAVAAPGRSETGSVTPADDRRHAIGWVRHSSEYQALCTMVFTAARARLEPIIAAARADHLRDWSAMPADEFLGNDGGQPPAVIFDLDETLLDNSAYELRQMLAGASYDDSTWLAWSGEARARAIPGAVEFTRWLDLRGVRVYYISNRSQIERDATLANLRALGFPVDGDGGNLLLRDDAAGFGRDKVSRRQLVDREHRVIAQFGDNLGDFLGGVLADDATRRARVSPYQSWWGERWFVLPNPMYGSWLEAIRADCGGGTSPGELRACMDRSGRPD